MSELSDLKEENEKIRKELQTYLYDQDQKRFWVLIGDLIENEIDQEEMCNI